MNGFASTCIKRFKKSPIKIGTHSGVFHCDELLGTFMLQLILPDSEIIRSRDGDVLKECDIVIDVGNEFNPEKYLFDHHQRGFNESMSSIFPGKSWKTKLSSAGLVYCHFGKEVITHILQENIGNEELEAIFDHVYEDFIQEIDAIDNGVPMFEGEPQYRITTNLSSRVNRMNKQWNTSNDKFDEVTAFTNAQKYVGDEFVTRVKNASEIWWPARKLVADAIANRFSVHSSGQIIELERHCPWKEHFFNLEKGLNISNLILFVIFCDSHDNWRVQAVSLNPGSFVCRLFLYSKWRGLRDEELSQAANIEGCLFVHHTGFIGGSKTRDAALNMALKSIELSQKEKSVITNHLTTRITRGEDQLVPALGECFGHLMNYRIMLGFLPYDSHFGGVMFKNSSLQNDSTKFLISRDGIRDIQEIKCNTTKSF